MNYSFIIPVYNRPEEIKELLESFTNLEFKSPFEIVIIEDGSTISAKDIVASFAEKLNIQYLEKSNSGPGDSRNFGMRSAQGDYFIILDSDCILPTDYLQQVDSSLIIEYVDCFGGPDAAHYSFSDIQKSINFAMTSVLSTGGVRGNKINSKNFQPRSFNMGISREAFIRTGGFAQIHPGEDPDLAIRIWKIGMKTKLIPEAYVYHKRRISWSKFFSQVNKFGKARPILDSWHPEFKKFTFWFPTFFTIGLITALILAIFDISWPLILYALYCVSVFITAIITEKSLTIGIKSVIAVFIQMIGYGLGFIKSYYYISILKRNPEKQFPKLFFKNAE